MHGTVCLLRAGQPRRAGYMAKSGQFVGQFSWVAGDPMVVKGLSVIIYEASYNPLTTVAISKLLEMIGGPHMSSSYGHRPLPTRT